MDSNTELAAELKGCPDIMHARLQPLAQRETEYVVPCSLRDRIITALTQPAEQIADGALGVTQRDREAAAAYVRDRFGDDLLANEILRGTRDRASMTVHAFARHAQQARAQALEEAAKVAEQWRDENKASAAKARKRSHFDHDIPHMAEMLDGAAIECNAIAAAIRALQPHGQGGGE